MTKEQTYHNLVKEISAVLEGEPNMTARYATVSCLLNLAFEDFFWTGFYLADPDKSEELVVGPYQGTLGCLRIPFGKGVCGVAAKRQSTIIVNDVHAFPGHIACDSRTNSEIVVPVFNKNKQLLGVLDVDSKDFNTFDQTDQIYLEKICELISQH